MQDSKRGISGMQVGGVLAGLAGVAGLALAGAVAGPAVAETPTVHAGRLQLERFAGREPDRCVFSAPDRELCRWRVEGRVIRRGRTDDVGVASGVNLVCELPVSPASRARGLCDVHALEPGASARLVETEASLPPVSAPQPSPLSDPLDPDAVAAALAQARTLRELSRLLGDVPESCLTGNGVQTCRWRISEGPARDMFFAAAPAATKLVELRCRLPLDGRPRAAASCAAKAVY